MRTGSIQLARIFGIRIGASPSWFVVALIFIVWLSTAYDDQYGQTNGYLMAVVSVALFFLSLLLHELGHAWVARRNGIGIAGIDLWFFGGIAKLTRDTESPGEEFRVSAAGPAVTLLIVIVACGAGMLAGGTGDFSDALFLRDRPGAALAVRLGRRRQVELAVPPRAPAGVAQPRAERPSVVAEGEQKPAQQRSAPTESRSASQRPERVAEVVAAVLRSPPPEGPGAAPVATGQRPPERVALLLARSRPPRRPTARS